MFVLDPNKINKKHKDNNGAPRQMKTNARNSCAAETGKILNAKNSKITL